MVIPHYFTQAFFFARDVLIRTYCTMAIFISISKTGAGLRFARDSAPAFKVPIREG